MHDNLRYLSNQEKARELVWGVKGQCSAMILGLILSFGGKIVIGD